MIKNTERRLPKPMFVRANDFKRVGGVSYIVKRNEFSAATYVVGKAYRKLSTKLEVEHHTKMGKLVCMWGGKYFLYTRITPDIGRQILETIWEEDVRRGVPLPEMSDYDKASFDI